MTQEFKSVYGRKEEGQDLVVFCQGHADEEGAVLAAGYVEIAIEKEQVQTVLDKIARDPEHFHEPVAL